METKKYKFKLEKVFNDNEFLETLSKSFNDLYILYRIYSIDTNKSYVGTTDKLYNRINNSLIGHKIKTDDYLTDLYSDIRNFGLNRFEFMIEEVGDELIVSDLEEVYISVYDSFYNGYNRNLNGKSGCLGLVCVVSVDELNPVLRKVKPSEAKEMVESGMWRFGGLKSKSKGRIYMFNPSTNERNMVYPDEVGFYISLGFLVTRGFSPTKGKVSVINQVTGECIRVTPEELSSNPNLKKGRNYGSTTGRIRVTNGIENRFIPEGKFEEYKYKGFWRGGITRKVYKNKGKKKEISSSTTIETTDDNKSGKE